MRMDKFHFVHVVKEELLKCQTTMKEAKLTEMLQPLIHHYQKSYNDDLGVHRLQYCSGFHDNSRQFSIHPEPLRF